MTSQKYFYDVMAKKNTKSSAIKQITLRGPRAELARRLKEISIERGESLNQTVLSLLEHAVGLDDRSARLHRYMTAEKSETAELDAAIAAQRTIDPRDWQ
jgi:hypothetical protein